METVGRIPAWNRGSLADERSCRTLCCSVTKFVLSYRWSPVSLVVSASRGFVYENSESKKAWYPFFSWNPKARCASVHSRPKSP